MFADTQLVQSSVDNINREISVSLVGTQLSDTRISELTDKLADYNLGNFTLHVMQNKQIDADEDNDKVIIAVQENTIRDLQDQLEEEKAKNKELEGQIDCAAISEKAASIFTKLTDVRCGIMFGENGNTILLTGKASAQLSDDELETIRNFLKTESGISETDLQIDTPEATP